jgi:RHS repeat-associated protein
VTNWTPQHGDQQLPLMLGTTVGNLASPFDGKIDEVRIYSRALSLDEVKMEMSVPAVVETDAYDNAGQLVTVTSPEGTIHYEYDAVTGLHTRTWTAPDTFATAPENRIIDPELSTTDTHYSYDTLGRLDAVTQDRPNTYSSTSKTTDYVYDLLGNLDQTRLPNGVVSDYDYDNLNRLKQLVEFKDGTNTGNVKNVYEAGVDTLLAQYNYDLLADGKRSGVTENVRFDDDNDYVPEDHETRIDWFYDSLGRLTREVYDSQYDDSLDFVTDYALDLVGNRLSKNTESQPDFLASPSSELTHDAKAAYPAAHTEQIDYVYDANDRLLVEKLDSNGDSVVEQTTTYAYGPNARLSTPTDLYGGDGTQQTVKTVHQDGLTGTVLARDTYEYNLQGRMSQTRTNSDGDGFDDKKFDYMYDDNGVRVRQAETTDSNDDGISDSTTRTAYLNDGNNPTGYSQVLEEKSVDASGNVNSYPTKTYTLGSDVIAQYASGDLLYLLYDGHGSTRLLTDAYGSVYRSWVLQGGQYVYVPQAFRYDAFGVRLDTVAALTTLLFSGEQTDATGLQYLRARYYNPNTGRFNSLDPFAGDVNDPQSLHKYLYCHANPVNGIDPSGQFFELLMSLWSDMNSTALTMGAAAPILSQFMVGGAYMGIGMVTISTWDELANTWRKRDDEGEGGYNADVKLLELRDTVINAWTRASANRKMTAIETLHTTGALTDWDVTQLCGNQKRRWSNNIPNALPNTLTYKGRVYAVAEVNYLLWGLIHALAYQDKMYVNLTNFGAVVTDVIKYRTVLGGALTWYIDARSIIDENCDPIRYETISGKVAWTTYGYEWATNKSPRPPEETSLAKAHPTSTRWPFENLRFFAGGLY